jgi:hypothetical protein
MSEQSKKRIAASRGFYLSQGGIMAVATKARHGSETSKTQEKSIEAPQDLRQRIAEKAYALYEQRGKREGYALQDWLDAEYLVNEQIYEAH